MLVRPEIGNLSGSAVRQSLANELINVENRNVNMKAGDYVMVKISQVGSNTHKAIPIARTTISEFSLFRNNNNL